MRYPIGLKWSLVTRGVRTRSGWELVKLLVSVLVTRSVLIFECLVSVIILVTISVP